MNQQFTAVDDVLLIVDGTRRHPFLETFTTNPVAVGGRLTLRPLLPRKEVIGCLRGGRSVIQAAAEACEAKVEIRLENEERMGWEWVFLWVGGAQRDYTVMHAVVPQLPNPPSKYPLLSTASSTWLVVRTPKRARSSGWIW
jgi:hypothetical protein